MWPVKIKCEKNVLVKKKQLFAIINCGKRYVGQKKLVKEDISKDNWSKILLCLGKLILIWHNNCSKVKVLRIKFTCLGIE